MAVYRPVIVIEIAPGDRDLPAFARLHDHHDHCRAAVAMRATRASVHNGQRAAPSARFWYFRTRAAGRAILGARASRGRCDWH
jgi:hypothetical protein